MLEKDRYSTKVLIPSCCVALTTRGWLQVRTTKAALFSSKPLGVFFLLPVSGYRVKCEAHQWSRGLEVRLETQGAGPSTTLQLPCPDQVYRKHMWGAPPPAAWANSAWGLASAIDFTGLPENTLTGITRPSFSCLLFTCVWKPPPKTFTSILQRSTFKKL